MIKCESCMLLDQDIVKLKENYERKPLKGRSKMKTFEDLVCDMVEEKFKDLAKGQYPMDRVKDRLKSLEDEIIIEKEVRSRKNFLAFELKTTRNIDLINKQLSSINNKIREDRQLRKELRKRDVKILNSELVKLKTNCEESFNEISFLEDELEKTQIRHHNLHAKEQNKSSINNKIHNAGTPWNEHEDRQLRIEFHNALEEIAKIHGRSYGAIESRIKKYWND